jgi:glycerol kinase
MAFQTLDVVDAISAASGTRPAEMRVDGGASVMDLLCQFQADLLGVPVRRATVQETTALGAAYLAGIAEGVWETPAEAAASWTADASFTPAMASDEREARVAVWHRAVERSRAWETGESESGD